MKPSAFIFNNQADAEHYLKTCSGPSPFTIDELQSLHHVEFTSNPEIIICPAIATTPGKFVPVGSQTMIDVARGLACDPDKTIVSIDVAVDHFLAHFQHTINDKNYFGPREIMQERIDKMRNQNPIDVAREVTENHEAYYQNRIPHGIPPEDLDRYPLEDSVMRTLRRAYRAKFPLK